MTAVRRLLPYWPLALLVAAYFGRFAVLSVRVQDAYGAPGFDMGIFDQGVWLLSRFHAPFVTVMGRDLFGDHTSFVLLLAVPLYWVWPSAAALLVLQTALIAGAAVPVYLLARRRLGSTWLATGLASAYLLNPALQWGNLEQFHPECFLVLFIAVALYAALEWHPVVLVGAVLGSLLVKEDTALLLVPLGLWVYLRRDRRYGAAVVVGATGYMVFAYEVVIRSLLGTDSFYSGRIPFGGIVGLVAAPFAHPARFWSYLTRGDRLFYAWQLAASTGGVFLLSPEVAAVGGFTFLENFFSRFPYMQQIFYHYSLPLVPVLAMGTVFAVARLRAGRPQKVATALVTASALVSCTLWGLAPWSRYSYPHSNPDSPAVQAVDAALRVVPADAVVSAAWPYVSHLDHRVGIYQWPTPFRAAEWGLYDHEGERLPAADSVQYLVIPSRLSGQDGPVFASISGQFVFVAGGGGASVYRRIG